MLESNVLIEHGVNVDDRGGLDESPTPLWFAVTLSRHLESFVTDAVSSQLLVEFRSYSTYNWYIFNNNVFAFSRVVLWTVLC